MHPEEQLSAYLDGELTAKEKDEVEVHLADCSACLSLLNDMMNLKQTVSIAMMSNMVPPNLESRVTQSIAREEKSRLIGKALLLVPILAATTMALLAYLTGPVIVRLMGGIVVIGRVLLFAGSRMVADTPMLAGAAIILSLILLSVSILSLRRLLQSTAA
ncbi:anti-sigma factor family protein [Paenibacillus humicola]|uniref:anti-sigma factor family protein n=1 Tax=Paenibacillus humicola TaxID=3110540 RepID=UPI00237B86A4|nr:anti-sigma factor [Paenibacillus humicola]